MRLRPPSTVLSVVLTSEALSSVLCRLLSGPCGSDLCGTVLRHPSSVIRHLVFRSLPNQTAQPSQARLTEWSEQRPALQAFSVKLSALGPTFSKDGIF